VIAASAVNIKGLRNVYKSSTLIVVDSANDPKGSNPDFDLDRRLASIREQVTSRTRLEQLIVQHNLYPDMTGAGQPMDRVVEQMKGDIDVDVKSTRPETTDSFVISYRSNDPALARNVAADLAAQLINENVEALQSQAAGEVEVLRQRESELHSELSRLERQAPWLLTIKEDSPVASFSAGSSSGGRTSQMAVEGLKDQQYRLEQQAAALDRRIAEQRQIVAQQKNVPPPPDPAYGSLLAKRAELEGQRDNYRKQQLTDKHPRVVAIDDQIAAVNRAIAEVRRQSQPVRLQTDEDRELRSLESERHRLGIDLEIAQREIGRRGVPVRIAPAAPAIPRSADSARLAQDYVGLKQSYRELNAKLENAELKQRSLASPHHESFRVLDAANLPQAPISPDRRLLGLVALALALVAGLACGALREVRRLNSLHNARDVEYHTRLPLLAAIPGTRTEREARTARRLAAMRAGVCALGLFIATIAVSHLLTVTRLFELLAKK
jgi:uncharacterized protein involved in exopolysaccharide biosynthesis